MIPLIENMFLKLILSVILLSVQFEFCFANCDSYGTIYFNQSSKVVGCPDSYFNIEIVTPSTVPNTANYNLKIADGQNSDKNGILLWENVTPNLNFSISSKTENVVWDVSIANPWSEFYVPFFGLYTEHKRIKSDYNPGIQSNGTINYDNIKPNSEAIFQLKGYGDIQQFHASWNLPNNLGYISMEHNGRKVVFSNPKADNLKFAISTPNGETKWTVIGNSRPDPVQLGQFRLEYFLGPEDPITTTTPVTTTTTLPSQGQVQIYIVAVNEATFVEQHLNEFWNEIQSFASECSILRSNAISCVNECALSMNPDRGCVTFTVTIAKSAICHYTKSDLKNDLENMENVWEERFGASRVDFDDCLTPAEVQWLSIAILIPVGSGAFVFISYFLVKTWLKNQKRRRYFRRKELEKMRESKASMMKSQRHSSARNISQFVIMEEDEE